MNRCSFIPYEGNEPYVFVSYAHKDSDRVYPILEELNRRGYRVWYDDGIAPGSEWPENIAQHLSGCALTLAFISPSSIASDNCRREVTFALSKRKPFLGILLEPTEMSLGMEMQLSAQQCIMKYSYATEESFLGKVCACPDLQPCLKPQIAVETPAPTPVPVSAPARVAPPAPPASPAPASAPKQKKPADKKMVGIIAGVAAAVVLILVLIIAMAGGGGTETPETSGESTVDTQTDPQPSTQPDESVLTYENITVTAETVAEIVAEDSLRKLYFIGCTFEADLSFLAELKDLRTLVLENCGIEQINVELGCLRLEVLDVSHNQLGNLDFLTNCTVLREVDVSYNDLYDADPLAKSAATLESLDISGNDSIYEWNISFLTGAKNLKSLRIDGLYLETLSFIDGLTGIEELSAVCCRLEDIDALKNMTQLKYLNLCSNYVQDISPLSNLAAEEMVLDLSFNEFTDLSVLPANIFYKALVLDCSQADLTKVPSIQGDTLVLHYSDGINVITTLDDGVFSRVGVVDCPTDKIVGIEDRFGVDCTTVLQTLEELLDYLEEHGVDCTYLRYLMAQM